MEEVEIKVPALGESIIEATVGKWLKKPGEAVTADTVLVELETDKVTLEVYAPHDGALGRINFEAGATVKVGTALATFVKGEGGVTANPMETPVATAPVPAPEAKKTESEIAGEDRAKSKPDAAKPAATNPKPAEREPESKSEFIAAGSAHIVSPSPKAPDTSAVPLTSGAFNRTHGQSDANAFIASAESRNVSRESEAPSTRSELRAPMSRLRLRIAERLKQAQNTAAMLTTFNEADMSAIVSLRGAYKEAFEKKHGVKLGFMSFFVKACVGALKEQPIVNSLIDGNDIVTRTYNDIGVAVSTPNGLVVPIVRNADTLTMAEIEKTIGELGKKGREGKLALDEMTGGTFTITNGGVFGSLLSAPILNPPQSAILGMHKIQERPVVVNGQITIRPMMYLALSYDHRLVDGKEAVTFLVTVKECLENPGRFLLDL